MAKKRKKPVSEATEAADLASRAFLLDLDCGAWHGRSIDAKVSDEVTTRSKAERGAGVFTKRLFPHCSLDDAIALLTEARTLHQQLTLPWQDRGARLLPATQYLDYCKQMQAVQRKFNKAVDAFVSEYPALREKAKKYLGDLYDDSVYVDPTGLRNRFYIRVRVLPIPSAGDFRVNLPKAALEEARKEIEQQTQENLSYAMEYLWEQTLEMVRRFADRTEKGDKILREGLVNGLKKSCAMIAKLNLTEDSRLVEVKGRIEKDLAGYTAGALRDDPKLRTDVAKKARQIEKVMAGFMGKK